MKQHVGYEPLSSEILGHGGRLHGDLSGIPSYSYGERRAPAG
ncbi:MAG TPA: hypothetical protein VGX76_06945 [Pirellulales bacterium]|nr:hypothetical protein [Pirellulales bacterium]